MDSFFESPTTVVIAKFVGHKPSLQDREAWFQDLDLELTGSYLTVCRNVGKGYLLLVVGK